jgi:ABC-type antimicrobial peptide transport system permease subunit
VQFATAHVTRVAEGYLETIGTPLLRGRSITAEDRAGDARVAVISEPLANQLFPNADAIGERLTFALEAGREQEFTIVGVSKDFATSQLTTERPQMLLPLREETSSRVFLIARGAAGDEARLMSAIEKAIKEFDPDFIPKVNGHPAQRESGIVVTGKKLVAISKEDLIAESASVAGAGGIVMAATRTREIAVRIALGATRPRMLVLLLSDVVKLVLPGVAGGLLVAALLVHMIHTVAETPLQLASSSLGVLEPLIYVAACVIAVLVALLACLPAARRGASVQPMIALRAE